jgi:hypothetical protein
LIKKAFILEEYRRKKRYTKYPPHPHRYLTGKERNGFYRCHNHHHRIVKSLLSNRVIGLFGKQNENAKISFSFFVIIVNNFI